MSDYETRPNRFPWPPVILVSGWALAVILDWLQPLPWMTGPVAELFFAVGILVGLGGLAIIVTAIRAMRRAGTTVQPHRRSNHLVVSGPFAFTRNPLYLANAMLTAAIGLATGIVWFLLMVPAIAYLTAKLAIEGEEKHLALRFGKAYRDYARRVRRWF